MKISKSFPDYYNLAYSIKSWKEKLQFQKCNEGENLRKLFLLNTDDEKNGNLLIDIVI